MRHVRIGCTSSFRSRILNASLAIANDEPGWSITIAATVMMNLFLYVFVGAEVSSILHQIEDGDRTAAPVHLWSTV